MWFKHSMSITQHMMPIYNTTVNKNKRAFKMCLNTSCHKFKTPKATRTDNLQQFQFTLARMAGIYDHVQHNDIYAY